MDDIIENLKIPLDQPIDLVALAVKTTAIRCRVVATGEQITLRKIIDEVEGEILTVRPSKIWRLGQLEEARKIFERMLWLNPTDNQGIRFLMSDIDDGKTWYELNSGLSQTM